MKVYGRLHTFALFLMLVFGCDTDVARRILELRKKEYRFRANIDSVTRQFEDLFLPVIIASVIAGIIAWALFGFGWQFAVIVIVIAISVNIVTGFLFLVGDVAVSIIKSFL